MVSLYVRYNKGTIPCVFKKTISDVVLFEGVPYHEVVAMKKAGMDKVKEAMNIKFIADDDDYTAYRICLNKDDFTGFPDFDTDINASDDELDGARREPETWVTGTRGVDESDVSDDESDASDDESDTSDDELNEKFCITFEYDSHWNCWCKDRPHKVCGCGCDPLHDGW
jgi:hypothetical protein